MDAWTWAPSTWTHLPLSARDRITTALALYNLALKTDRLREAAHELDQVGAEMGLRLAEMIAPSDACPDGAQLLSESVRELAQAVVVLRARALRTRELAGATS